MEATTAPATIPAIVDLGHDMYDADTLVGVMVTEYHARDAADYNGFGWAEDYAAAMFDRCGVDIQPDGVAFYNVNWAELEVALGEEM